MPNREHLHTDPARPRDEVSGRAPYRTAPFPGLKPGEIYLFHASDPECPVEGSLWGQFGSYSGSGVRLETCTWDLFHFQRWRDLDPGCLYCRKANRKELRDYVSGLTWSECCSRLPEGGD